MQKAQKRRRQVSGRECWEEIRKPERGTRQDGFPKSQAEQERLGVRWDYDGEITEGDDLYHKFQMQPKAEKVPSSIKRWRESNGGTHAVMATALVKKDGSKEDA
ncbi:hypothetical protein N7462_007631 [Penicillium macrosclerotiorum]|uniref:uncharacterized protein n=1 Tax=Penicillium macrosclerotiorum TaxID=303699 RepID=UPI002548ADD1|nr:uncharacterized protein N7462_007631 [Penicillium macrosclerotiorum]KAJ5679387.1 hypothetical protein N7462_007631 [Penicillium macrosclerotiorum]